ncbi:MAG: efflux RND transporter periplasmic adaptor subunit [Bacteroidales bacterium]|nr:efflux RND transporter periplasmic adaptor subunit [Bacteroidales bacterium]
MKKRIITGVATAVVLVTAIAIFLTCSGKKQSITVETVKVKIGSVSNIVTATGTLEAIKTVDVGTQVSGEVSKIYVDYNSQVKAGQLLAELDRRPLTTALTISEAALDDARAEMTYQTANYNRIKTLFEKKLVAESDYDLALYNYEKAKTSLKTAQLNYDKAKINLAYAYIYSPIDGVILNRAVDEGQTVAASFSTPTLFSIANDLTRMQVEASIDEADIGQVKNDQRVDFTVDAYPDQKFTGKVTQIRLEPVITSNVVTYMVIVEAPNPDKKLMPGMTANITIYVEEANEVLTLSSKALRFKPNFELIKAYYQNLPDDLKTDSIPGRSFMFKKENLSYSRNGELPAQGFTSPKGKISVPDSGSSVQDIQAPGSMPANSLSDITTGEEDDENNQIWVKTGYDIYPVTIEKGIDNDIDVEVISGLKEGDEVVVSMSTVKAVTVSSGQENNSSPFMPKPPSRRSNKKSS